MKKPESRKRVEAVDALIAESLLRATETSPCLTYSEILCALAQVTKRYTEYLIRTENEVTQ